MPWARVDGGFHGHPKRRVVTVSEDGLWARALSRASEFVTDGYVETSWVAEQLASLPKAWRQRVLDGAVRGGLLEPIAAGETREMGAPARPGLRAKAALVEVGPFELDGYLVHDFLHYNPARAEVEEAREREREKARRRRSREPQGAFTWSGQEAVSPGNVAGESPLHRSGESPLKGGHRDGLGRGTATSGGSGESDARAPELAATIPAVLDVLAQSERLHVDQVGVENAVTAWPAGDPVQAARQVITWVTDPAFTSTNAARLLERALSRQQQDDTAAAARRQPRRAPRGAGTQPGMDQARRFLEMAETGARA